MTLVCSIQYPLFPVIGCLYCFFRFPEGWQDFVKAPADIAVAFQGVLQFMEHLLHSFPVVVLLFRDIDPVTLCGLIILPVQEQFLIKLLPWAKTGTDNLFPTGSVKMDHLLPYPG